MGHIWRSLHVVLALLAMILAQSASTSAASSKAANCSLSIKGFGYNVKQGVASLKLDCTTSDGNPLQVGINSTWINANNSNLSGVAVPSELLACQNQEQANGNCAMMYFCDSSYVITLHRPFVHNVWWDEAGGGDPSCWSNLLYFGPNTVVRIIGGNFSYNADIAGSVVSVSGGDLAISDSLFLNNTCGYGAAALWARDGCRLALNDSNFDWHSAYGGASDIGGQCTLSECNLGGAILVSGCNATINKCSMSSNSVAGSDATAGALATTNSTVSILSSNFSRNVADGWGGACWFTDSGVDVYDSLFTANTATSAGAGGAIGLSNSSVRMIACNLTDNAGLVEGGAVALWEGINHLYATDCIFVNNSAGSSMSSLGGALFADVQSAVVLSNCTGFGNRAAYGGFLYATNVSAVLVTDGTLLANNTAFVAGGAIWANGAAVVNVSDGTACIYNRAATAGGDMVVLGGGGGIGLNQSARAYLSDSNFSYNSASEDSAGGGAVLARDLGYVSVINSVLSNNTAASGGAIRLHGLRTSLALHDSVVSNNNASMYGGGIHVIDGQIRVIGVSRIIYNIAGSLGGGMRLETPDFVTSEVLAATTDNKAFHDSDVSVEAANISIATASPNRPGLVSNLLTDGSLLYILNVTGHHGLPCAGTTVAASIRDVANPSIQNTVMNASDTYGGVYLQLSIAPGNYTADIIMDGNMSFRMTFPVHLSGCIPGQVVGHGGLCQMCLDGSYSLVQHGATCHTCPRGVDCPGGAVIVPEPSYWRSSVLSDQVHRCPNAAACQGWQSDNQSALVACTEELVLHYSTCSWNNSNTAGCNDLGTCSSTTGSVTYSDVLCSAGYYGNLCGECAPGFGSSKPFTCRKCMSHGTIIALYAVAAVVLLGLIKTLCYFTLRETATVSAPTAGGNVSSQKGVPATDLLKPLVLYFQYLLIIVGTSSIEWPNAFAYPFRVVAWVFSTTNPETLSPDCLFSNGQLPAGLKKTFFYLITPLVMMAAVLVLEGCLHLLHIRSRRTAAASTVDRLASTAMVVLFFFLPSLVRTTLNLFACAQIDKLGASSTDAGLAAVGRFWLLDLNQPCFQGYHRAWALGLGIPLTILVCVALPVTIVCLTVRGQKRHLYSPRVPHHYMFLYKTYKPSRSYWEACVTLKTTVLVAITVFGHSFGSYFQVLLMTFVLVLLWFTLSVVRPYQHRVAQKVMEYGMVCLFTTSFVALTLLPDGYVQDGSTNEAYKLAAGIILTCLNSSFVAFVFYQLCRTVRWNRVLSSVRWVHRRWCGSGLGSSGSGDLFDSSNEPKANGPQAEVVPTTMAPGNRFKESVRGPAEP